MEDKVKKIFRPDLYLRAVADNNKALLSYYMGELVSSTAEAIYNTNEHIFNGSASSVADLYRLMDNGKLMQSTFTSGDLDAQKAMENAVYSVLIPYAWSLSTENMNPVVIDTGYDCSDTFPSYFQNYMTKDTAQATAVCYNNALYYLLDARYCQVDCEEINPEKHGFCEYTPFFKPYGIDELDGNTWGGVSKDNLTIA